MSDYLLKIVMDYVVVWVFIGVAACFAAYDLRWRSRAISRRSDLEQEQGKKLLVELEYQLRLVNSHLRTIVFSIVMIGAIVMLIAVRFALSS